MIVNRKLAIVLGALAIAGVAVLVCLRLPRKGSPSPREPLPVISELGYDLQADEIPRRKIGERMVPDAFVSLLAQFSSKELEPREDAVKLVAGFSISLTDTYRDYVKYLLDRDPQVTKGKEYYELMGRCDLDDRERKSLLADPKVPDHVKARLGDRDALQRLLAKVGPAKSPKFETDIAKLLYIGLDVAEVRAVFRDYLNSDRKLKTPSGYEVTPLYYALVQYRKAYYVALPGDDKHWNRLRVISSPQQFKAKDVEGYLRGIEEYFKAKHDLTFEVAAPFFMCGEPEIHLIRH